MRMLRWPGSKWNIAHHIVSLMPKHNIYLEPFFGSGAVFFEKSPSRLEVLNDLDGEVVNLFRCIRNHPEELARLIYFTPYSREEYYKTYDKVEDKKLSDLERARLFLVRSNMARGSTQAYASAWRHTGPKQGSQVNQRVTGEWNRIPQAIFECAKRLKDAEIENTDALELIKKYNKKDCLIYADPPYLSATRKQRYYINEMTSMEEHVDLINVLKKHAGPVILSCYENDIYDELLKDWHRVELDTQAELGKKRKEIIWMNFAYPMQMSLFDILE